MRNIIWWWLLAMTACALEIVRAADVSPALLTVSKVRFLPLAGHESDMLGARILASNLSANDGFIELAAIRALPASGQWGELTFSNATPYRIKAVAYKSRMADSPVSEITYTAVNRATPSP
jgi:hypothetical protein